MTKPRRGPRPEQWERQPDETRAEFAKFRAYLDTRSVRGSYRVVTGKEKDAPGSWYELAERRAWADRALAWDTSEGRKMEAALRGRRLRSLVETAELGETLRKKAAAAARMVAGVTQRIGERDGKEVVLVEVQLSPGEIVQMAKVGTELEQLALGHPTSRTSQMDGGLDQVVISVNDAKQEMLRRLADIKERQQKAEVIKDLLAGR